MNYFGWHASLLISNRHDPPISGQSPCVGTNASSRHAGPDPEQVRSASLHHVAIGGVAAAPAVLQIGCLLFRYAVEWQFVGGGVQIDVIEAGAVEAEDRALRRAVGGAKRGEGVFLLHVVRDFQPPERFYLPLRGAIQDGVTQKRRSLFHHESQPLQMKRQRRSVTNISRPLQSMDA